MPPPFNMFKVFGGSSRQPQVVAAPLLEDEGKQEKQMGKLSRRRVLTRKKKDKNKNGADSEGYGGSTLEPVHEVTEPSVVPFGTSITEDPHDARLGPPPPIRHSIEADDGWPGYHGDAHSRPSFDRDPGAERNESPSRLRENLSEYNTVEAHPKTHSAGGGSSRHVIERTPTHDAPSIIATAFHDSPANHHGFPPAEGFIAQDYAEDHHSRPTHPPSPEPVPVPPPIRRSHTERMVTVDKYERHSPRERGRRSPQTRRDREARVLQESEARQTKPRDSQGTDHRPRYRDRERDPDRDRDRNRRPHGSYRDAPPESRRDQQRSTRRPPDPEVHQPILHSVSQPQTVSHNVPSQRPIPAATKTVSTPRGALSQPPLHKPTADTHYYVVHGGTNVIFQDEDGNEITRIGNFSSSHRHGSTKSQRRTVPIIVQDEFGRELYRTGTVSSSAGGTAYANEGQPGLPASPSGHNGPISHGSRRGPNLYFIDSQGQRQIPIMLG